MTKAIFAVLILATTLGTGCATVPNKEVDRIPDTPEALAAFRQCSAGGVRSLALCMAGISGFHTLGPLYDESQYRLGPGCREVTSYYVHGVYHSVQACGESPQPPSP